MVNPEIEMNVLEEIKNAQMILVGLGEEFDVPGANEDIAVMETVLREEEMGWLIPMMRDIFMEMNGDHRVKEALEKLAAILEGKNYFVISKARSSLIVSTNWREGRLVMVCGNSLKKQCSAACEESEVETLSEVEEGKLRDAMLVFLRVCNEAEDSDDAYAALPSQVRVAMEMIRKREKITSAAKVLKEKTREVLGSCKCCGNPVTLNVLQSGHYDERGYLKDWEWYAKWLSGTMNRELLLLELGCDARDPEVIHGPFSKIHELNLKSKLFEKRENVIDWLLKL